MITYREATSDDSERIAQLHSLSWQQNYRGIWRDVFLDDHVVENRREVWRDRLKYPTANQYVIIAESEESVCGFACAYSNEDSIWGTLLDNLHVHREHKGQGIGTRLIQLAASWSYHKHPESGFYLWVLAQNIGARTFYENLGAVNQELVPHESPDGGMSDAYRYTWTDVKKLL